MSAILSACMKHRYRLARDLSANLDAVSTCLFIMLNPSTADAELDDPTIRRCKSFAAGWGYGRMEVANLFSWRATKPEDVLVNLADANNDDLHRHLIEAIGGADLVVCAWGKGIPKRDGSAATRERASEVLEAIKRVGKIAHCLGLTKGGSPLHPLYLRADLKPEPWR